MPPPKPSPTRLDDLNALPLPTFQARYMPHLPSHLPSTPTNLKPSPNADPAPDSNPTPTNDPYSIHLLPSASLSDSELSACFHLIQRTSCDDYKASLQGWHPARKRREMLLRDLRYLLITGSEGKVEGILSFMLTIEDGGEVVYVYEVHLEEGLRGRGVGRRVGVGKVMLTVFKRNEGARGFYAGLGFGVDEGSPRGRVLRGGGVREADYLILSKGLVGVGGREDG